MIIKKVTPKPPVYTLIEIGFPKTHKQLVEINDALLKAGSSARIVFEKHGQNIWNVGGLLITNKNGIKVPLFSPLLLVDSNGDVYHDRVNPNNYTEV